jgi:hypothetical protein
MVEDSSLVRLVIGVAADVIASIDQQDPGTMLGGQALREDGTRKAGPDDEVIVTTPGAGAL